MSILDRLPAIVSGALSGVFVACTIARDNLVSDGRGGFEPSTQTEFEARGLIIDYQDFARGASGGLIKAEDRKILILAHEISYPPRVGDIVDIGGRTWRAIAVKTDPATATYEIQARPT